jgi:hypothetical protein
MNRFLLPVLLSLLLLILGFFAAHTGAVRNKITDFQKTVSLKEPLNLLKETRVRNTVLLI